MALRLSCTNPSKWSDNFDLGDTSGEQNYDYNFDDDDNEYDD